MDQGFQGGGISSVRVCHVVTGLPVPQRLDLDPAACREPRASEAEALTQAADIDGAGGISPCRDDAGRKIDIAARPGVTTGNGAEQRQVADAGAAQFRLMRPQGGDHVLGEIGRGGCAHRGFPEPLDSTKVAGEDGVSGLGAESGTCVPFEISGVPPPARSARPWPSVDRRGVETRAITTGSPEMSSAISNAMSATAHTEGGWANGPSIR